MVRKISRLRDFGTANLPSYVLTWSQRVAEQIEAANADLQDQITAIAAAQAAAAAAQAAATTAQSTADTVNRNDSISTSWTSPGAILSASDAGTDATITVANHTRKYTDVSSVAVTGGSITGLAYSTTYYVYYDEPNRAGGAVTYRASTNPNDALPNAAAGRHFCGQIATPASGGTATSGGVDPPGGGGTFGGGGAAIP